MLWTIELDNCKVFLPLYLYSPSAPLMLRWNIMLKLQRIKTSTLLIIHRPEKTALNDKCTVCPKSLVHFYIANCYMNIDNTPLTCTLGLNHNADNTYFFMDWTQLNRTRYNWPDQNKISHLPDIRCNIISIFWRTFCIYRIIYHIILQNIKKYKDKTGHL